MIGVSSCDLLVAGLVSDDDALILRLRLVVGGGHFVIIVIIRRLRGRVFGGHRGGQVGALRLEAVGVGHVDHLVDNTIGTGVAELTVDIIALLVAVSLHRLARLGGVDAVLSLETVNGVKILKPTRCISTFFFPGYSAMLTPFNTLIINLRSKDKTKIGKNWQKLASGKA